MATGGSAALLPPTGPSSGGEAPTAKPPPRPPRLRLTNWNIAAINRNPWEYYIKHDADPRYVELMSGIERFIDFPGVFDIAVAQVFTDDMAAELFTQLATVPALAKGVGFVRARWEEDLRNRAIVTGFLKDKALGDKRLISMADRTTNCIDVVDGLVCRPTVTNAYDVDLPNLAVWWPLWLEFMFQIDIQPITEKSRASCKVYTRLKPIKKAKYPAIDEVEAEHSLALQALCLAIFDAIQIHMMNTLKPGAWYELKQDLYSALSTNKVPACLEILSGKYAQSNVIFLQETSTSFMASLKEHALLSKRYFVVAPEHFDSEKNQNSIALLSHAVFDERSVVEITSAVLEEAGVAAKFGGGDALAFTCAGLNGGLYIVSSFHGDTAGLQTEPFITAFANYAAAHHSDCTLLSGMDANAYTHFNKKKLHVDRFFDCVNELGLETCWEDLALAKSHTTVFNARTFCQTQLNKAIRRAAFVPENEMIDCNPKDYVIFSPEQFTCTKVHVDNTGGGPGRLSLHDPLIIMPGITFPSDHAIVTCTLEPPGPAGQVKIPCLEVPCVCQSCAIV